MDPLLRKLLFGSTAHLAPPNDEGAAYEEVEGGQGPEDDDFEDDAGEGDEDEGSEAADGEEGSGDDGEDEGEEDRPAEVSRPKSRGENRVAAATRIAAEAKREAEAARAELAAIRQREQQNNQRETLEQRAQRLAMMDPDQRTQYLLQEQAQHFENRLNAIQFTAQDSADRTAFEAMCARNPVAAKHKDLVEAELQRLRQTGSTAPRETILNYVVGRAALAAAPRAKAKAERNAANSRTRQVVRPASGRSDVGSSGRRGDERTQRFNRIKDLEI